MDESFTRGYCQLRSDTPTAERRSDPHTGFGVHGNLGPPRDTCSLIYISLVLCGMGFLLPYNSFITAVDYYQAKYPASTIIFDMSMMYISMAFIGVVINNFLVELFSSQARISFGYVVSIVTLLVISLTDVWFELFSNVTSYRLNLVAVASVALGCTVQQSSFYGFTSMLPQRYTQAVMTGESAAGLMVSVNRILTKALLNNPRVNTIIFFGISITTVFVCCIVFHLARRTEFVRYFVGLCETAGLAEDQRGITSQTVANPEEVSLVDILDGHVTRDTYGVLVIQSPTTPSEERPFPGTQPEVDAQTGSGISVSMGTRQAETQMTSHPSRAYRKHIPLIVGMKRIVLVIAFITYMPWKETTYSVTDHGCGNPHGKTTSGLLCAEGYADTLRSITLQFGRHRETLRGCWARYQVARTVWPYMISIGLAYFVTLSLFPGIESEIVSCRLHSWMPIILITIFNLFDFIGKIIASVPFEWPGGALVLCSVCRIILIPLLMLCAAPRTDPVLSGEAWAMVISLVLGVTNGYFGSVPMIIAPGKVPDEQKELTGNIMTLSYSLGLTTGSAVAYLLDAWLGPQLDINFCVEHNATSTLLGYNVTEILKVLSSELSSSLETTGV